MLVTQLRRRLVLRLRHQLAQRCLSTEHFCGAICGLDDGSESTIGQDGHYDGAWDIINARPHGGEGVMTWDNGITYDGEWENGLFHGGGSKMYSRGGGYAGEWVEGRRQGDGIHIFAGLLD